MRARAGYGLLEVFLEKVGVHQGLVLSPRLFVIVVNVVAEVVKEGLMLCRKRETWIHRRCAKTKRVTPSMATLFV